MTVDDGPEPETRWYFTFRGLTVIFVREIVVRNLLWRNKIEMWVLTAREEANSRALWL